MANRHIEVDVNKFRGKRQQAPSRNAEPPIGIDFSDVLNVT